MGKDQKMRKLLIAIDGNHLAYRCKYTFSLSNKGVDVSITYGFLRVMNSIINKFRPTSVMVGWDGGIPEFRRQAVPSYKISRHVNDDPEERANFYRQIDDLHDYALPLSGVMSVRRIGAEADDLVYHASRMFEGDTIIVTGDSDLVQAITGNVSLFVPSKDKLITQDDVFEEYGIELSNFVHWKALKGDSSDNIPGVPGIGDKTASKLFEEFGELTAITNAAAGRNPKGKLTGKLADNINAFGLDRIAKNVYVIALYADRVGARKSLWEVSKSPNVKNKSMLKGYMMRNSFASLLASDYIANIAKLEYPVFKDSMRCPSILVNRTAYL